VSIWDKAFWAATVERMLRGFAIAALGVLGGEAFDAINGVDWVNVLGIGAGGAVLSLLFSLAGQAVSGNGPSFVQAETVQPRRALQDTPNEIL
jgi:shikimate kinase